MGLGRVPGTGQQHDYREYIRAQRRGSGSRTAALDLWDDVANITISYTTGSANIVYSDPANTAAAANWYYTGNNPQIMTSCTVTIGTLYNGAPRGETFIHETGHALGLGHLGPYNGTWTNQVWQNDTVQWSVMSYGRQNDLGNTGSNIPVNSPAMADIYAIGTIDGFRANHTSDTVYGFNNNTGQAAFNFTVGGQPCFTIYDTGGTDTIDASQYSSSQTINLNGGTWSSIGGYVNNIGIYTTSTVERAIGGSGGDTITGNGADNTFRGNGGNDTINGAGGTDIAIFSGNRSSYTLTDLGGGSVRVTGPDGTDTLTSVERLQFADQTVTWPPTANRPDLQVTNVSYSMTNWTAGQTVTGTYTVQNFGNQTASNSNGLYNYIVISTDSNLNTASGDIGYIIDYQPGVPSLAAGPLTTARSPSPLQLTISTARVPTTSEF